MSTEHLLIFLAVGLLAGFLAGHIWKGSGFGLVGNLIVGVVGSLFGVLLFGMLNISSSGIIGLLIAAIVGALLLLYAIRLIKRH
ncbi:GlsB/YeaQ/YmgE family stress response membrane protein [candidate division KSB1 bacterium]|nr:GlsB/YeaQ/YmgE family stress response membrane protein [candidate division KSB1 bacterium]